MSFVPLAMTGQIEINDGFLSVMIAVFLLMFLVMGPYRNDFRRSVSSMFKFKTPDPEISFPQYSSLGFVLLFILSVISMGIPIAYCCHGASPDNSSALSGLFIVTGMTAALIFAWLLLYHAVNKVLYRSQSIKVRPTRWNCFFLTIFAVTAILILTFSILVMFLGIPEIVLGIFAIVVTVLMAIGRIFRVITALFRNKRLSYGIILYLCALELIPAVFTVVIWSRLIN